MKTFPKNIFAVDFKSCDFNKDLTGGAWKWGVDTTVYL